MANYKGNNKVKYYTLDDGRIVTIKQLEDLTGIGKKTLWIRLKKTRDYNKLARPSQKSGNYKPRPPIRTAFEDTYKDLSPKLFKLLFGKW
tara:strand:+ start:196 stop:465 length:270 start_codon:yes stop_codon:yes gene_type:complete